MNEHQKRTKCAICNNEHLISILEYGDISLAGAFPKYEEIIGIKKYNLSLLYCTECHLLQTNGIIDPDFLFKEYRYFSSFSLTNHFNQYADYLIKKFSLTKESKTFEFGSNDGVLLIPMNERGITMFGFEPSENVSKLAIEKGCSVINDYFNYDTAKKYLKDEKYDLITASNTFAHIDNIRSVVEGIKYALKENGHFIFEVHYAKNLIEELQYDNIYHEHMYYYTVTSLSYLFKLYDMSIIDVEEISLHAGCIRVTVINNKVEPTDAYLSFLSKERDIGMNTIEYYESFKNIVTSHQKELLEFLRNIKNNGGTIAGYGASGRANMLCHFNQLDNSIIDYIIDESPGRYGRYINGIPIYNKDRLDPKTDYIFIFAWNYSKMIISKLISDYDYKYIIPLPKITVIKTLDEIDLKHTL